MHLFLIIISFKHWGLVEQHTYYYFFFFLLLLLHLPSSIIKQRRQFCSMYARVQSARSFFILFVTSKTGTPTHPCSSLLLLFSRSPFPSLSFPYTFPASELGARHCRAQSRKRMSEITFFFFLSRRACLKYKQQIFIKKRRKEK